MESTSSALVSPFADGAVPSFPASCFSSFFPLAALLIFVPGSFLADVFLGLGSGFGGTGFADNLADRLVGSCFVSLAPSLPSAFSGDFLFGIMTTLVQQKVKQRAGLPGTLLDAALKVILLLVYATAFMPPEQRLWMTHISSWVGAPA